MRLKWFDICMNMEKFNFDNSDMVEMRLVADKFYNSSMLKLNNEKNLLKLFESRGYLEGCISLLHSTMNPSENRLIKKASLEFDYPSRLENYFDSLLAIMDAEIQGIKREIDDIKIRITNSFSASLSVKAFRERLMDYMNHLITEPLWRACREFNNLLIKNKKHIKNEEIPMRIGETSEPIPFKEIFEYILFREVILTAKIKGLPLRQKISASAGMGMGSISETNIIKSGRGKSRMESPMSVESAPPPADDFFDIFEESGEEDVSEN